MFDKNIILVGMPGAGKSTIGPLLSDRLGMSFMDTDQIIRENTGRELPDIVKSSGYEEFLRVQEETILKLGPESCVIATGGSAVMSAAVMQHLKDGGRVVYLKLDYETIEQMLAPGRRLARNGGKTLRDVFEERTVLYEKYADIVVDCSKKSIEDIIAYVQESIIG